VRESAKVAGAFARPKETAGASNEKAEAAVPTTPATVSAKIPVRYGEPPSPWAACKALALTEVDDIQDVVGVRAGSDAEGEYASEPKLRPEIVTDTPSETAPLKPEKNDTTGASNVKPATEVPTTPDNVTATEPPKLASGSLGRHWRVVAAVHEVVAHTRLPAVARAVSDRSTSAKLRPEIVTTAPLESWVLKPSPRDEETTGASNERYANG